MNELRQGFWKLSPDIQYIPLSLEIFVRLCYTAKLYRGPVIMEHRVHAHTAEIIYHADLRVII